MPDSSGHNVGREIHQSLLESASDAVEAFAQALDQAVTKTRPKQYKALAAIYRLYMTLSEWPEALEDFYAMNGIRADPRSRYQAQPIIKLITSAKTRDVRVKASFWSGAIAWAERNGVAPDAFEAFISACEGGVDGAYRAELAARNGKDDREAEARRLIAAKNAYETENAPARIHELPLLRNAEPGKYLLVAEIDDEGNLSILAKLDRSFEYVESTYDDHIIDWFEEMNSETKKNV